MAIHLLDRARRLLLSAAVVAMAGAVALALLVPVGAAGDWTQVGSDIDGEAASDLSGASVAMSGDGTMVAVGAHLNDGSGSGAGHVRVYELVAGSWTQVGSDIDGEVAGDQSGSSVAMSGDGTMVAVGAHQNDGNGSTAGHVRVYELAAGAWTQVGSDIDGEAADDGSGHSVAMSSDGATVAIGAQANDGNGSVSGHVRVYELVAGVWTQVGSDIDGEATGDLSGGSVAMSSDGTAVAVGARFNADTGTNAGHVRVYELVEPGPMKDPGFAYVDANNDGMYEAADGDVAVTVAELQGVFDADSKVDDSGLVVPSSIGTIAHADDIDWSADNNITIDVDVTNGRAVGKTLALTSRAGDVTLDDLIVTASKNLTITTGGSIIATGGDELRTTDTDGRILLETVGDIDVSGSRLGNAASAGVAATWRVDLRATHLGTGSVRATDSLMMGPGPVGRVLISSSRGDVDVSRATLLGVLDVQVGAVEGNIVAPLADIRTVAGGDQVQITAGGSINLVGANVVPGRSVFIRSTPPSGSASVDVSHADILGCSTEGSVWVEARGPIDAVGARVIGTRTAIVRALSGAIDVGGATVANSGVSIATAEVNTDGDTGQRTINVEGATVKDGDGAPQMIGTQVGTPAFIGEGTEPCTEGASPRGPTGTITIAKVLDSGAASLDGFCFTLSADPGNAEVCADGGTGEAVFTDVPLGSYTVSETTSAAGYAEVAGQGAGDCGTLTLAAGGDSLACTVHNELLVVGPLKDPGAAYVDANNDQLFDVADGDVLLDDGELTGAIGDQWVFDTAVPEGPDYTVAIPGAGLVIPASVGGLSNRFGYDYRADGTLLLDTDLVAGRAVATTQLLSRSGDVLLDDPTVRARRFVGLEALNGSVIATDGDELLADGNAGKLLIEAAFIDVSNSILEAGRQVLLDAFTNAQGSVVAVNSVIDHTNPNGEGPTAMLPIDGGLGVGIYGYDDITVDGATIRSKDLLEIASGRNTFGAGLYALACNSGGNGHLTIGGGDNTLLPGSTLGGARGVFLSAGGFAGDALNVSNSYIADARDGAGDFAAFGIAPVLFGGFDIDADGATILGGDGAPVLFAFGGTVSTAGATTTPGFSPAECVLPS